MKKGSFEFHNSVQGPLRNKAFQVLVGDHSVCHRVRACQCLVPWSCQAVTLRQLNNSLQRSDLLVTDASPATALPQSLNWR
jgi:hypothetical protein